MRPGERCRRDRPGSGGLGVGHADILVPSCRARRVLSPAVWRPRAAAHAARLAPYVEPHLARRQAGDEHPVHDFLFSYYSQRPAQLLRWHPGYGVALEGAEEYAGVKGHEVSTASTALVTPGHLSSRRALVESTPRCSQPPRHDRRTPAASGCTSGRWSTAPTRPRHAQPLRLGAADTDTVVEQHRIACYHFDAFRFFTDSGPAPQNALSRAR